MTKRQILEERKKRKSFSSIQHQSKFNWNYALTVINKRGKLIRRDGFPAKWLSVKDTDSTKTSNKKRSHKLLLS